MITKLGFGRREVTKISLVYGRDGGIFAGGGRESISSRLMKDCTTRLVSPSCSNLAPPEENPSSSAALVQFLGLVVPLFYRANIIY